LIAALDETEPPPSSPPSPVGGLQKFAQLAGGQVTEDDATDGSGRRMAPRRKDNLISDARVVT